MSQIEVVHLLPHIQKSHKKQHTNPHSYAPFLSTVDRSVKQKKNTSPGPGHYGRQSTSILQQQINHLNGSSMQKGSSPAFRDAITRFKIEKSNSPGPADYSPDPIHKQTLKKKNFNVFEHYRVKFPEMYSQYKSVSIQSYTKPKRQGKSKSPHKLVQRYLKGTDWSKSKQKRFKSQIEDQIPGPGFYYHPQNLQKTKQLLSPQFISGSPRSFIDNIIYQSNTQAKHIPYQHYKNDEPGPGSYNVETSFQMNKAISGAKLLLGEEKEKNKNLRYKKAKLNNLSNLLSKSSSYNNIEPLLRIQQINPTNM